MIDAAAIGEALGEIGLRAGDTVLVHSDAIIAAQLPPLPDVQRLGLLIDALQASIGPTGTLVMPAFSYSFTKSETFDVMNTPSKVGMLTEHFRTLKGVCRSADPIFSVAAKGARANELCSASTKECFGPDSVFAVLHRLNSYIVCLGCALTSGGTFVHYVEKSNGVDYRYDKVFPGTIVWPDRSSTEASVVYYVRKLERKSGADLRRLQRRLEANGQLKKATLGRVRVLGVRAADIYETASQMLREDPSSLIEEGASREA
jgi:aminoglycoside 3-N-acetyltransferase